MTKKERDKVIMRWALWSVFIVGVVLRLGLALVNTEANDNHLEVSSIIIDQGRIPTDLEAWEAFQPKLYHVTVAVVWKWLAVEGASERILVAQLISCLAGAGMLFVVLKFLYVFNIRGRTLLISFSLVALNPRLVGISAQATNDSFVILFGSLAVLFGYLFFREWCMKYFFMFTVFVVMAGLSKGNGLILAVSGALVFVVALFVSRSEPKRQKQLVVCYGVFFVLITVMVLFFMGPYWSQYKANGTLLSLKMSHHPFPKLIKRTYVARPGVISIADYLFTFRLVDMIKMPMISSDVEARVLHRTSLWSQLYGRTHFVHFNSWPPVWVDRSGQVLFLGRLLIIFALFPTVIFVVSLVRQLFFAAKELLRVGRGESVILSKIFLYVVVIGYLGFIIMYPLKYRDFSAMKVIFVFPGLLGFLTIFFLGYGRFYEWCKERKAIKWFSDAVLAGLFVLYVVDIVMLMDKLV